MAFTLVGPAETQVMYLDHRDGLLVTMRYFGKRSDRHMMCEAHRTTIHNRTVAAHFHPIDQFQIILGAPGGLYQRTPLSAFTLQWADAFTTYGPIIGTESPAVLFTLRAEPSDFTAHMPGAREKLIRRGRRHLLSSFDLLGKEGLPAPGAIAVTHPIERDTDGLEALDIAVGPQTAIELPDTQGTLGQFIFVAEGSLRYDGKEYPEQSIGWVGASEGPNKVESGDLGARMFVMKFPSPSTSVQDELSKYVGFPTK